MGIGAIHNTVRLEHKYKVKRPNTQRFVNRSYNSNNNNIFVNNPRARTFVIRPSSGSSTTTNTTTVAVSLRKCVRKGIGSFVKEPVVVNEVGELCNRDIN